MQYGWIQYQMNTFPQHFASAEKVSWAMQFQLLPHSHYNGDKGNLTHGAWAFVKPQHQRVFPTWENSQTLLWAVSSGPFSALALTCVTYCFSISRIVRFYNQDSLSIEMFSQKKVLPCVHVSSSITAKCGALPKYVITWQYVSLFSLKQGVDHISQQLKSPPLSPKWKWVNN